uniref:alpha-L-fucosidase n=1 Tax=Octactis speculum TaxID=3111310 RepID=A0A7S2BBA2_9STRA|mmetsp:Transcript_2150/g.2564  ORF Transcript_2150/g.2564 Transcript_2150/m.2564 type:complete len:201 (+) Transcript_2150:55-657(+)
MNFLPFLLTICLSSFPLFQCVHERCVGDCVLSGGRAGGHPGVSGFNASYVTAEWLDIDAPLRCPCPAAASVRRWQGLKFGLFLHWGAYSVAGVDASWSLSWDDLSWAWDSDILGSPPETHEEMRAYRAQYWGLPKQFNPLAFDAEEWARVAEGAGVRYVVFTTKHHDGFAMYNTTLAASPGQVMDRLIGGWLLFLSKHRQ